MCNKIKFTKAFPLVDLIPFWRREQSQSNHLPISGSILGHFRLLVDLLGANEVSGNGSGCTAQMIPLGGPQIGPKSTPFFI